VCTIVLKRPRDRRVGRPPAVGQSLGRSTRLGRRTRREDLAQGGSQLLAPSRTDVPEEVARIVHLAALPAGPLKVVADRNYSA
jgi:hypothetical protein